MSDAHLNDIPTADTFKYDAFISYRHVEPDATIAARIHSLIESFNVPKDFYVNGKKPSYRVFRDREELTTKELSESINDALHSSKYLIVICSKRTPLSPWCVKEVETFLKLRGQDYVIPVLVEGEPSESFPPPLLNLKKIVVGDDGEEHELGQELLAAELRPAAVQVKSFVGYQQLEENNDPRLKELTKEALALLPVEKYRIMAAMLGVTYGDLKQRDKERRTKRLLSLMAIAAALLLVFGIFMFNAYTNAERARKEALQTNSAMLLKTAQDLSERGDPQKAVMIGRRAFEQAESDMPLYTQLKADYFNVLNNSLHQNVVDWQSSIDTNNRFTFTSIHPTEDVLAAGLGNDSVALWQLSNGKLLRVLGGFKQQVKHLDYSPDGRFLAAGAFDNQVKVWDSRADYAEVASFDVGGLVLLNSFSSDGKAMYIVVNIGLEYKLFVVDTKSWQMSQGFVLPSEMTRISFNPARAEAYVLLGNSSTNEIPVISLNDGRELSRIELKEQEEGAELTYFNQSNSNLLIDKNGEYLYTISSKFVSKFDLKDQRLVFRKETGFMTDLLLPIALSANGEVLYYADGGTLIAIDTHDGEKLFSSYFDERVVSLQSGAEDLLCLLLYDGSTAVMRGEQIISTKLPFGEGKGEYLEISPDGAFLLVQSLTDRKIRIAKIAGRNIDLYREARLLKTSDNRRYALFYNFGEHYVWDVVENKVAYQFDELPILSDAVYGRNSDGLRLSNDGRYLATVVTYESETGENYERKLEVFDLAEKKVQYSEPLPLPSPFYSFTPDSQALLLLSPTGDLRLLALADGELLATAMLQPSWVTSLVFSDDGAYFAVNYNTGLNHVYSSSDYEKVFEGNGSVLDLSYSEAAKLQVRGVYMDAAFFWEEGQKEERHSLRTARAALGEDMSNLNVYDRASNFLLTLKTIENEAAAVLLDFSSGALIANIAIDSKDNYPYASLLPGGKGILIYEKDTLITRYLADGSEEYELSSQTKHYRLADFAELEQDGLDFSAGRELTEAELLELGISE